ncbi:Phosphatidylglycerophosphatase A [Desulfonispora thiosulfatigenes DSM 11270]|uniref:Phosphatidylglycerophosphatase A n=1 Tax=Desulfonispora thiosulfatigenes DSM 11270 TaxID=656914 RepID=A0A1W1UQI2_DESTI|nr:phosphatidylglycerophosphatase A [Desulfonispora thiosulfatigenes]SMB83061.1 Phosphatidylglycerophosphatase A [Desulfonispora thiosulfatigenes DSM 11270]
MKDKVKEQLRDRGVELQDIADIVHTLQIAYYPDLLMSTCLDAIDAVLEKREVQYAVLTGIALDMAAEQGNLPEPILGTVQIDEPLYGVDEILAMAITNIYGTIGITSFGYLDKMKIGIIGTLDSSKEQVNTFLDDLVAAIASASAAKIAHAKETGLV